MDLDKHIRPRRLPFLGGGGDGGNYEMFQESPEGLPFDIARPVT